KDFLSFKADLFAEESKLDPIKKAELIREIAMSIAQIPSHIKREVYIKECSKKLDISIQALIIEVNRFLIESRPEKVSGHHAVSKSLLINPHVILTQFEKEYLKVLVNNGSNQTNDELHLKKFEFGFQYLLDEASAIDFEETIHGHIHDKYAAIADKNDIERMSPKV